MRFLLSGGGTAGHIYPALTVASLLAGGARDDVLFVGTPDGLEARLVPEAGVAFEPLSSAGFDRGSPLTLVTSSVKVLVSAVRAWRLVGRYSPDVVVGFGGYVSLPVGLAAVVRRVPLVIHEQNSVPGLANRVLSRWAKAAGVTYESSVKHLAHPERAIVTGNPVRDGITRSTREAGRRLLGIDPGALVLLVFGGSRGARRLNDAVVRLWPKLAEIPSLHVLHVTGGIDAGRVSEMMAQTLQGGTGRYQAYEYLDDMGGALAAADLVVARAGATSIAEITAIGRASVLVPYPYATDDHQTLNARAVAAHGAAVVISDAEVETETFEKAVLSLLLDEKKRQLMATAAAALGRPDAGRRVADLVRGVVVGHESEETR
ncbi:MAG: undecaprenyldiphospho-muramoylpentapeptide beta-N-acetylglucosaminyltransferase [Actinomycetia bacterium]|nr:undecaprenyldiphospho-muramoylpentapeptide beta-N-acetylglucosaminyltransferase [Actinomycetes bacterium]